MKKLVLIGLLFLWSPFLFAQGGAKTSGGGAVTGTSGAVNITAGGTNQNITLTPSGSGASVVANFQDKGGQVFNVKAYGAKGDGTTDDTAAINAAKTAAEANGGVIFFPPGIYLFSSTLSFDLSDSGIIVDGVGRNYATATGTILKWNGASGGTMIKLDGANRMLFQHMTLDGNSLAGRLVQLVSTASSTATNIFQYMTLEGATQSPSYAISVGETAASNVSENEFNHIIVKSGISYPFYQDGSQTYTWLSYFQAGTATVGYDIKNGWFTCLHSEYGSSGTAFNIVSASSKDEVDDFDWEGTGKLLTVQDGTTYNFVNFNGVRARYDGTGAATIVEIGTSTGTSGQYNFTNCVFQSANASSPATISLIQSSAALIFNQQGTIYESTPSAVSIATSGSVYLQGGNKTILKGSVTGSTTALAANTCGDYIYLTLSGVATASSVVWASPQGYLTPGLSPLVRVFSANTVQFGYCNNTSGSITPTASTWNIAAIP